MNSTLFYQLLQAIVPTAVCLFLGWLCLRGKPGIGRKVAAGVITLVWVVAVQGIFT